MRADPYTTDTDQTMRPAPNYGAAAHDVTETAAVRLLGENEPLRNIRPGWERSQPHQEPRPPRRFVPYASDDTGEFYSPPPDAMAPQFALYTEVDGWADSQYRYNYAALTPLSRPTRTAQKLLLPIILALLAFGLFVIAAGPILARGEASTQKTGLNLSDYRDHAASNTILPSQDSPPIVDARTEPEPQSNAPQPAALSPGNAAHDVVGAPSLSVAQIERVLRQYGSPAAGKGQALYDLGIRYGIDPAYALAFFVHESGCGTKGVARFTQSLGNIRWTSGFDNYEGYRKYPSWEAGMEDWYKLITKLYIGEWNLRTVDKIIPVYAPWGDNNNPPAYIRSVKAMVESWRGK